MRASDFGDAGQELGVLELSSGRQLGTVRVTDKPAPGFDNGFNPNSIVLLSEWNDPMGH